MSRVKGNHEMAGLRMVRSAHNVAFEFVAQDACIALDWARPGMACSAETHDTDPDRGGGHVALEVDENVPSTKDSLYLQCRLIGRNYAPLGLGIAGERWLAHKRAGCKRCARDDRARRLQKSAPVVFLLIE